MKFMNNTPSIPWRKSWRSHENKENH